VTHARVLAENEDEGIKGGVQAGEEGGIAGPLGQEGGLGCRSSLPNLPQFGDGWADASTWGDGRRPVLPKRVGGPQGGRDWVTESHLRCS
jgi:hypothetical protein